MRKRLLAVLVILSTIFIKGCKNRNMIGQYTLKEITTAGQYYTQDTLKSYLGKEEKLDITSDKIFWSTTYTTNGNIDTTVDEFLYDTKYLNDTEDPTYRFYSYEFTDDMLIIHNLSEEETIVFIKQ